MYGAPHFPDITFEAESIRGDTAITITENDVSKVRGWHIGHTYQASVL